MIITRTTYLTGPESKSFKVTSDSCRWSISAWSAAVSNNGSQIGSRSASSDGLSYIQLFLLIYFKN